MILKWKNRARILKNAVKGVLYRYVPKSWLVHWIVSRWPKAATLEVTTHCGLHCPLCPTHIYERKNRLMEPDHALDVIETSAPRLRAVSFHLQGEPLMHKGLFDFVRACSSRGISSGFSTNGMLVDRYQEEILDSGLNFFSVAIDGCDQEDYEKYRVGGDFGRVTEGLRSLLAARKERQQTLPVIQIQTVMFPYNEDREEELVEFMKSFGADEIRLKRPSYCASGDDIEASPKALEFMELAGSDREEKRYARTKIRTGARYRDRALCPQLERAEVLSDGRMVACSMDAAGRTAYGQLGEESFEEIWRGPRHRERIRQFLDGELSICRHCDLA